MVSFRRALVLAIKRTPSKRYKNSKRAPGQDERSELRYGGTTAPEQVAAPAGNAEAPLATGANEQDQESVVHEQSMETVPLDDGEEQDPNTILPENSDSSTLGTVQKDDRLSGITEDPSQTSSVGTSSAHTGSTCSYKIDRPASI